MNKQHLSKRNLYLLFLLLGGIVLLFSSNAFSKQEVIMEEETESFEALEKRSEEKLRDLLCHIDEIRDVSVMLTLDQISSGKERPHARGVAIICNANETPELRLKIVMLVSSVLGLSSDKIYVTFS